MELFDLVESDDYGREGCELECRVEDAVEYAVAP